MILVERLQSLLSIDDLIAHAARVTYPKRRGKDCAPLLASLMRHGHWSPFDMVSVLIEVSGISRACSRQLIRHHSIRVQEASQRWARLQEREYIRQPPLAPVDGDKHVTRQHPDPEVCEWFERVQRELWERALALYDEAIARGLHNETARALLPEGLTPTRICLNGTVRSWIHFLVQRLHPHAQFEIRLVALGVARILEKDAPITMQAAYDVYPEMRAYKEELEKEVGKCATSLTISRCVL